MKKIDPQPESKDQRPRLPVDKFFERLIQRPEIRRLLERLAKQ